MGLKKGVFITFEGPEGCGKSTHSGLLVRHLVKAGFGCVHTREPGGTALGESVRELLLHSKRVEISDLAELFLFEAARAQIVREVIRPALSEKKVVVCDRFSDATLSYQGYGGGLDLGAIRRLDDIATGRLKPDLTILLDIDTRTGLERARRKGVDRMERKDAAYHARVRAGYLALARAEPRRIRVVRVTGEIGETRQAVRREVESVIRRYQRAA
jgi:dTMP kinase